MFYEYSQGIFVPSGKWHWDFDMSCVDSFQSADACSGSSCSAPFSEGGLDFRMRKVDVLNLLGDRVIAFQRPFVKIAGSVTAALMLSQIVHWTKVKNGGSFYKTQEEWEEETGLTRREQETARKAIVERGLISEWRSGVPAKLHFQLDLDRLCECMTLSMADSAKLDCTIPPNKTGVFRQTNTESTPESTTKKNIVQPENTAHETAWTEFRSLYPKRLGSLNTPKGKQIYLRLLKEGTKPEVIEEALRKEIGAWRGGGTIGTAYIPQIPSWLNKQPWNDHSGVLHGSPTSDTGAQSKTPVRSPERPKEDWRG